MMLADYIAAHLSRPFAWGEHDCVLFAARWVARQTGRDPLAGLPPWSTMREALRVLQGVGGIEAALDARFPRVMPNLARDGDLALYGRSLCLFSGPHVVGPAEAGLLFIDRMQIECAWSV